MLGLIIVALVIWAALIVLGFAVKTLFWLAVIGIIMFILTVAIGVLRGIFEGRSK